MTGQDMARSFLDSLVDYGSDQSTTRPEEVRPILLGTVDPAYTTGLPRVTFDGEAGLSGRGYPWISPYRPTANDRVALLPIGRSYVIIGAVALVGVPPAEIEAERLRLTATNDASESSTGHAFQIGPSTSTNLIMDQNELIARDNGVVGSLFFGGTRLRGASTITPTANDDVVVKGYADARTPVVRAGSVTITPVANAYTFATITFPAGTFPNGIACVQVTASTTSSAVLETTSAIDSDTQIRVGLLRTNTTATGCGWAAFGA